MANATIEVKTLRNGRKAAVLMLDGTEVLVYASPSKSTAAEVKASLLEICAQQQAEQSKRRILQCGDGTMLVIYYQNGWVYDIAGSGHFDRGYASSVHGGANSFDEMLETATRHADQSYGGVVGRA